MRFIISGGDPSLLSSHPGANSHDDDAAASHAVLMGDQAAQGLWKIPALQTSCAIDAEPDLSNKRSCCRPLASFVTIFVLQEINSLLRLATTALSCFLSSIELVRGSPLKHQLWKIPTQKRKCCKVAHDVLFLSLLRIAFNVFSFTDCFSLHQQRRYFCALSRQLLRK